MLVVIGGGVWAMLNFAPDTQYPVLPSPAAQIPTQTPVATCLVSTGLEGGRVNLRACAGTSCAGLSVVADGQVLQVIKRGEWLQVVTADNLTGYIKSKFCK